MRGRRISAVAGVAGVLLAITAGAIPTNANASRSASTKAPTWRQVSSPNPKGIAGNSLNGVACATTTTCVAVGSTSNGVLVVAHTRHGWVRMPAKLKGGSAKLDAVSCATKTSCVATGYTSDHVAAVRYNGKRWSTDSPRKPQSDLAYLSAVSCPTTSRCWTVGQDNSTAYGNVPLAEHYRAGTWKLVPVKLSGRGGVLSAIDCISDRECWAVGQSWKQQGGASRPLVERWNGTKWHQMPSPKLGKMSGLTGISCVSQTDCYAAGNVSHFPSTLAGQPFVEHFNGHAWRIAVKWAHYDKGVDVFGISCAATARCAVVGDEIADAGGDDINFVLDSGKHGWHQSTVAQPDAQPGLSAVACPTVTDCYAVGSYSPGDRATSATLIVHRS